LFQRAIADPFGTIDIEGMAGLSAPEKHAALVAEADREGALV